jgi:hypothetical protein
LSLEGSYRGNKGGTAMAAGIVDSKDILDLPRYLKSVKVDCMDHLLGPELVTLPQYISSTRAIMFTAHLKQLVTLNNPEFPRLFTNYENTFGKLSSSIHKAKDDLEVYKIVSKFPWSPKHLYVIFFYNKTQNTYSCITKQIAEELTEKFGYGFNNKVLDSLNEGDEVAKGKTLWKSTSYDEDDNYCFGRNALTAYLIDNRTIEDAVICSESFSKKMVSKEVETVKITLNDNDLLLNLYGDGTNYKGFPDIGEKIKGKLICSKRRLDNNQILYDMKKSNLVESNSLNDKEYYSKGEVMDVDIYCNQPIEDIPVIAANAQILQYLHNQQRYWEEIKATCEEIAATGAEYDDDIGFLLGRAKNYLDGNFRWKDNDSVFNNIIMEISVQRDVALNIGYKISGRYGNKGVISTIVPDEEMPTLDNGRHVDVVFNTLGVINRLNSAQLFEISINFMSDRIVEKMKTLKTRKEREKLLWKYLAFFNERGMESELEAYYEKLSEEDKEAFFASIYEDGIYVNLPPISTSKRSLFDTIKELHKAFPWIKPYDVYIHKWGRHIKLMKPLIVGAEYIIKLKQTAKKNFSVRSTGYLSQKGLPDKSNKSKHNQQLYSTTPIKIGRDENNNLAIGIDSRTLAKFHLFYRSSPAARREVGKLYTQDPLNFKKFKIKKRFKNRNVEILNAYFKSEGYRLNFGFDGLRVPCYNNMPKEYRYKGTFFLRSNTSMRNYLLNEKWTHDFNKVLHVGTAKQIKKKYDRFVKAEKSKMEKHLFIKCGD